MLCYLFPEPTYLLFSSDLPSLLYYTHIPSMIIALTVGFYVFWNDRKSLLNQLLFCISSIFSLWVIINLVTWTNIHSDFILFFWSFFGIIHGLIAILSVYFIYVFLKKKDITFKIKWVFIVLLAPIILLTPSSLNLGGFNLTECDAFKFENLWFEIYHDSLGLLAMIWIFVLLIKHYRVSTQSIKKQIILIGIGVESFLFMFFVFIFTSAYLANVGILPDSQLEMYGLLGMVILMIYISILIVRFKTFHAKLFATQALVWGLIILIGSQYFTYSNTADLIITSVTFLGAVVLGRLLINSVRKEIEQKELLEIANKNQMILVRFITHQVKGFFTKSKAIFAGLMEGDFGETTQPIKDVARAGLDSDNNAVEMISEILNASNLRNGQTVYSFETINFSEFTNTITDSFKTRASDKNLSLDVQVPEKSLMAKIDKMQMTQVVKNLIDNAINYTPTGKVSVILKETTHEKAKFIQLAVTDSGVGLTDKDKSVLFREGGHGDESLKVNVNSTGYGLFIVKKIIEGHNGTIVASSAGRNKGSTFTVELPEVIE